MICLCCRFKEYSFKRTDIQSSTPLPNLTSTVSRRHKHDSHRCTGLSGPDHRPCRFTLRSLRLDCPFAVFPPLLYPSIFALLPHVLSLSCPSLSPSFCCWMRDILLRNTHTWLILFPKTHSEMRAQTQKMPIDTHKHMHTHKKREINRAFWNAKLNSTQERRAACCQVSTKYVKLWFVHYSFHWNLKVIEGITYRAEELTIGNSKNNLQNSISDLLKPHF